MSEETDREKAIAEQKSRVESFHEKLEQLAKEKRVDMLRLRLELTKALAYLDLVDQDIMDITELEPVGNNIHALTSSERYYYTPENIFSIRDRLEDARSNMKWGDKMLKEMLQELSVDGEVQ